MIGGAEGSGVGLVVLGIVLIVASPLFYRFTPGFDRAISSFWFGGRQPRGGRIRQIGNAVFSLTFGLITLSVGIGRLVRG